jgi:hypothetical protein
MMLPLFLTHLYDFWRTTPTTIILLIHVLHSLFNIRPYNQGLLVLHSFILIMLMVPGAFLLHEHVLDKLTALCIHGISRFRLLLGVVVLFLHEVVARICALAGVKDHVRLVRVRGHARCYRVLLHRDLSENLLILSGRGLEEPELLRQGLYRS